MSFRTSALVESSPKLTTRDSYMAEGFDEWKKDKER